MSSPNSSAKRIGYPRAAARIRGRVSNQRRHAHVKIFVLKPMHFSEILVSRSRNHEPVTNHIFVIVRREGCSCMEDVGNPNHPTIGIVELFKIFSTGFPLVLDF
jgi:hypothetical protein